MRYNIPIRYSLLYLEFGFAMYYDDDPNLPNDYDDDIQGDYAESHSEEGSYHFQNTRHDDIDSDTVGSMSTARRKRKKLFEDQKSIDKGYGKVHIYVGHKRVPVEYYSTNDNPDSTIRNAITGVYETGYKVGKWQEDMFFKVGNMMGSGRSVLFYDSPHQYEKHFFTTLDESIKEKWEAKAFAARQRRNAESEVRADFVEVR